uniref:Uncharacterized protein n=1 Tax=Plectus sambesii TaxID=2011161 RepID=A0A914XDF6_9BILA
MVYKGRFSDSLTTLSQFGLTFNFASTALFTTMRLLCVLVIAIGLIALMPSSSMADCPVECGLRRLANDCGRCKGCRGCNCDFCTCDGKPTFRECRNF